MKLLKKTNRYYLLFTSIILTLASTLLFITLNFVSEQQDELNLHTRQEQVINQIRKNGTNPYLPPYIEVKEIPKLINSENRLGETHIYNPIENEKEEYTELIIDKKIKDKNYRIIIRNSHVDADDYVFSILVIILILFGLMLGGLAIINSLISSKVWSVFYVNLAKIQKFSINQKEPIKLDDSNILEFTELNKAIEKLTNTTQSEFKALKEFTENASHEMQTPLAIVQLNTENLIQDVTLNESQSKMLEKIGNATNRMSSLTQGLLLLAKIDNQQFGIDEQVNVSDTVNTQITFYNDLFDSKKLTFTSNIESNIFIKGNHLLCQILFSNLLNNAIKHNINKGKITVILTPKMFKISNTGTEPKVKTNQLFDRFKKSSSLNNSVGLGLSIVKKISIYFDWRISYLYEKGEHSICVFF